MLIFAKNDIFHRTEEAIFVELVKACLTEKSILFWRKLNKVHFENNINRMRNLHLHVQKVFGEENVMRLQKWGKTEKKWQTFKTTEDSPFDVLEMISFLLK